MSKSYFVTGTDTDVGKTIVSCLLTAGLGGKYWKPIQSGTIETTDSQYIDEILGYGTALPESIKLKAPLSPNQAAFLENRELDINEIVCPQGHENLIVEGAGGLMVPITKSSMMIDLIAQFSFPCILVARSTLGTLNHTLLSIEALKRRGIEILGVVLNGESNKMNRRDIEYYGQVPVILELQEINEINKDGLIKIFQQQVNKEFLS